MGKVFLCDNCVDSTFLLVKTNLGFFTSKINVVNEMVAVF